MRVRWRTKSLTALVADTSVPSWWVLPAAVALMLAGSVWRMARTQM